MSEPIDIAAIERIKKDGLEVSDENIVIYKKCFIV